MNTRQSLVKRALLGGGLALGVLATAVLGGSTVGAQRPPGAVGIPSLCPPGGCLAPPISAVEAKAAGTYALVSFSTLEPAAVTVDYTPTTTAAPAAAGGQSPAQGFATTHERKLTGLTSNTTYDVTVTATTQAGQKHTAKTSFTTAKKVVRIILQSIDITDDGDGLLSGGGEPLWFVEAGGDGVARAAPGWVDGPYCYPSRPRGYCEYGKLGEGRITPLNPDGKALMIVYAEENFDRFPSTVSLKVWAKEDDAIGGASLIECVTGGCPVGDDAAVREWRVPPGVEFAQQIITMPGVDASTGFESVLTFHVELVHVHGSAPWPFRNRPSHTWFTGLPTK
jgi:hypothetical protein